MRWKPTGCALAVALFASTSLAQSPGELNLYNWGNYTSPALIAKFEDAYDVKVTITEFDSNPAALAKVLAGEQGFDLAVLSANYVKIFADAGLLLRSRPHRMENFKNVAAQWRNPAWDRGRRYSAPWQWGSIGMIVDSAVYSGDIDTSAIVFDPPPELEGKINVAPERDDIIAMALLYVGAKPCTRDAAALQQAREVLLAARPKWRSMEFGIAEPIQSGDLAAAAYWSGAALRARRAKPSLRFGYPIEGFALWMDSVVVLKDAANVENAKLFQNFIMAPENAALISAFAGEANGIDGSEAFLPAAMQGATEITISTEAAKAGVFLPVCPDEVTTLYTALWAELTE